MPREWACEVIYIPKSTEEANRQGTVLSAQNGTWPLQFIHEILAHFVAEFFKQLGWSWREIPSQLRWDRHNSGPDKSQFPQLRSRHLKGLGNEGAAPWLWLVWQKYDILTQHFCLTAIYLIWGLHTRPLPGAVMLRRLRPQPRAGAKLLVGFPGSLWCPDFFCSSQFPRPSPPTCAALGHPIRWVSVDITTAVWLCGERSPHQQNAPSGFGAGKAVCRYSAWTGVGGGVTGGKWGTEQ